jgi:PAS domain-containing protein
MWSIKILKGPKAGEKFQLKQGDNIIGRGNHCDICIPTPGISKEHAKIVVTQNAVYIMDLNSTNGTFVNGTKIQKQKLRITDKVSFFDTMISFEDASRSLPEPVFVSQGNQAFQMEVQHHPPQLGVVPSVGASPQMQGKPTILKMLQNYIETVLLPGVYKLAEVLEFKWVIASLIMAFIFAVTLLSVLPMAELTKSSIQQESQRRALSLARSLAEKYQAAVKEGVDSTFNAATIEREEGVQSAFIISSNDGTILAPARKAGQRPDEPFIHTARKQDQQVVSQINDSTVGASVPLKVFDTETGSFHVTTHAMVLYDMGSLAFDSGRTVALFVQVLAISFAVGALLFFFLYKLMERPISLMNRQIDQSLKDGQSQVHVSYLFPELQDLITNINTALQRASQSVTNKSAPVDRNYEANQLIENYPAAALAIDKNLNIASMNASFEELIGLRLNQLQGQNYSHLNDQALILNLKDLFDQVVNSGLQTQTANLEFSGKSYRIVMQPILSDVGISYFLISFSEGGGGF